MKKLLLSLAALCAAFVPAVADTFTYDFTAEVPSPWVSSTTPFAFETSGSARGAQYNGAGTSTLTLAGARTVRKIKVTYSANLASNATLSAKVGNADFGSYTTAKVNNTELTYEADTTSGTIVLTINRTSKSVYIKQIVVEAAAIVAVAPGDGEDPVPDGLDPDYQYASTVSLTPTGETGNNAAYSFVQNNVKVDVSTGGQSANYFGCNATKTITFTATKPICGLVVNGWAKSGFAPTTSAGTIDVNEYCADNETEGYPLFVVKGADSKTITITCNKQVRIFQADLYFDADPTIAAGANDGDMYSFDPEPTDVSTKDVTFGALEVYDYRADYGYTMLYLYNYDQDFTLGVYADAADVTGVVPGTYKVDFSYDEGTVLGSYGRYTYYDGSEDKFTSSDITPVYREYAAEDNPTPWYIYDGTLTVEAWGTDGAKLTFEGTSYNWSTIKASYTVIPTALRAVDGVEAPTAPRKLLRRGQLVIERDGHEYNAAGQRIK